MKKNILIMLLFILGCAPWMQTGGQYTLDNISVDLPGEWMRYNSGEFLLVTRDGVLLQQIFIKKDKIDEKFKHTKKKLTKEMLPQEAAEVIIDDIASDRSALNFEVLENVPAQINGLPGFKLIFTYKNSDGLRLKSIYYGFISDEWFYNIRYTAASRYYFDKDVKTFEEVFKSFRLTSSA